MAKQHARGAHGLGLLAKALPALALGACVSDPRPLPPAAGPAPRPAIETAAEPGEAHRALDPLAGEWRVEIQDASGQVLARGEALVGWGPSGRFLRWEATFELAGGRSHSTGLLGHDAAANEYQWVWASGWSGRVSLARGRGDLRSGGLRLVSEEPEPASGLTVRARSVMRLVGADRLEIEQSIETGPGVWRKTASTIYTRAAPPAE